MRNLIARLIGDKARVDQQADPKRLAAVGEAVRRRLEGELRARNRGGRSASLFVFREFLTAAECEPLIRAIDAQAQPSPLFNDGGGSGIRTSSTHYFPDDDGDGAPIARRIDTLLGVERAMAETLQGQRYTEGQEYRPHCDFFRIDRAHWQSERGRGGQRTWTAMIYLNSDFRGGTTEFPRLGLSIAPEQGMLVAWDNMTRRGTPNRATIHAGAPVLSGRKYVLTQWYRLGPWQRYHLK
jgi:prolyl 4-hydroxylase